MQNFRKATAVNMANVDDNDTCTMLGQPMLLDVATPVVELYILDPEDESEYLDNAADILNDPSKRGRPDNAEIQTGQDSATEPLQTVENVVATLIASVYLFLT
jgi:hypothetical protein